MSDQLGRQQAPANIMQHLAEADRKVNARFDGAKRNDPCPCGSGRKFKQCHGRGRIAERAQMQWPVSSN
jgi:uncharacterized protein YchJ